MDYILQRILDFDEDTTYEESLGSIYWVWDKTDFALQRPRRSTSDKNYTSDAINAFWCEFLRGGYYENITGGVGIHVAFDPAFPNARYVIIANMLDVNGDMLPQSDILITNISSTGFDINPNNGSAYYLGFVAILVSMGDLTC